MRCLVAFALLGAAAPAGAQGLQPTTDQPPPPVAATIPGDFPEGIAVDAHGTLYTASLTGGTVYAAEPGGPVRVLADSGIRTPLGLAVGPDGLIYVADTQNPTFTPDGDPVGAIKRVAPDGRVSAFIPAGAHPALRLPNGLAFDAQGRLYITDTMTGRIWRATPDGTVTLFLDGLQAPNGIAFDARGRLVYTAYGPGEVWRVSVRPDGSAGTPERIAHGIPLADGVAVDSSTGAIYVAANQYGVIRLDDPAPGVESTPVPVAGGFDNAASLVIRGGKLYISDSQFVALDGRPRKPMVVLVVELGG